MNFGGLDLNLLVLFDALLAERHLTRAARAVGMSQSAASGALARLRRRFDDPLFVRAPEGFLPTARARELAPVLGKVLGELEHALAPPPFDPARVRRTFGVTMSEVSELVVLPGLAERLAQRAPGMMVRTFPVAPGGPEAALGFPEVDIAFNLLSPRDRGRFRAPLYRQRHVALVRRSHRRLGPRATLEQICSVDHVVVDPRGLDFDVVGDALAARGLKRRVALQVASFAAAVLVAAETDLVAVVPSVLSARLRPQLRLRELTRATPLLDVPIGQYWRARDDRDPAHCFLRSLLREVAEEADDRMSGPRSRTPVSSR